MSDPCKTANHPSNNREMDSRIDALRELMDERDRRYQERFEAQKEGILKAEAAQNSYNLTHNDLIRKMDDLMPRTEANSRLGALDQKIEETKGKVNDLQQSRSKVGGHDESETASRDQMWKIVGLVMSILGAAGVVMGIVISLRR